MNPCFAVFGGGRFRCSHRNQFLVSKIVGLFLFSASLLEAQIQVAGTLYVDLRATHASAGSATWTNQASLGNFTEVGAPFLDTNVVGTGVPGVSFNGADAYQGPNSVPDLDGASDRSIEVWAYNPSLPNEETMVSWGHRLSNGRNLGFNFGTSAAFGAVTHFGGAYDVGWGAAPPTAGTWHHLTYTYSNNVTRVYIDGAMANSRTLVTALNTFTNEPINLACQRDSSNGVRSLFYSGYLNTVRVHGGVLSDSQIQSNYLLGPIGAPTSPPPAPGGLVATPDYNQIFLQWNAAPGANRYTVKRGTAGGGPYTNIAINITTQSYFDSPLAVGVTYYYVVSAGNFFGDSTNSSPVSATTGVRHTVDGLVHRWSFSETGGTSLEDTAGDADGQVIPLTGNYVLGGGQLRLFGGAKGTADYAEMPGGLLGGLSNVTVEAWVTPWSAQNWARLFDFGSGGEITGTSFFLSLCRGVSLNLQRLEFIPYTVDTGLPTTPGQQYHYVAIWGATNGTGGGGRMEWYRDGVLAGGMDTGPTTVSSVDDTVLWLGRSQYATDNTADADFNDVRLYNRVLTPAEINFNRVNGPDTIYVTPPVPVNDAMTLNPGAKALIPVLQNDLGSAIDPNSVTIVTPPSSGTAQVKPGGKVLYTHNGGLTTSDQFTYRIASAGGATSGVATVSLTISSALRLPNTTMTVPNTPPPLGYQVVDAFTNNPFFEDALALRTPPGSTNQLFVAERRGIISYIADVRSASPVRQVLLDISDQVMFDTGGEGEMGLLGFDFHPGFATNGYFFVAYTTLGQRQDRLSRFTANPITLTVDTNTQQILFSVVDEAFNHNGSDVHFGLDGYLYMSMGDEGDQFNFRQNAQRIDKDFYSGLLRIDVDRKPGNVEPNPHSAIATNGSGQAFYKIPINNPYVHTSLGGTWNGTYYGQTITNLGAVRGEFFATGLRHPWRFWIDPTNGEVWVGDVGQATFEEVNIVTNGGNYGWAYYEGVTLTRSLYPNSTLLTNPPPGLAFPLYTYSHTDQGGDPQLAGNAVIGGVVSRGGRLPEINGAYVFGDFPVGGASTIWTLRRTNSSVTVQRIASDQGVAAFGVDPSNGDVLIAAYGQNKVKRLVRGDVSNNTFPQKLSDTGVFADLASLAPNPGIVSYDPTIAFWSDFAIKRRWFTIPDLTNKVTFATDTNWTLPTGMKWIKHFDLELDRGNPNSPTRRLETRILVKTDSGNYGVSYKWNDAQDEAFLVDDDGDTFFVTITNGAPTNQIWEIPSRGSCLACHSGVGGHALTFNTREMNNTANLNGIVGSQIDVLSQAGYFSSPAPSAHTLPVYARAGDSSASLEFRVRSYLAVNCVQCHQPGGTAPSTWDARPYLTLGQTHLINTILVDNGGDPANKVIVPGDLFHSVLWQRIQGSNGFSRMPPLATHQLDQGAINLLAAWISSDLTNRQTFAQWQVSNFGSTNTPAAAASADPDGDGASNYYEYLTKTSPLSAVPPPWTITIDQAAGTVGVHFLRVANLGFVVETSLDFSNWTPWNVPNNRLWFSASNFLDTVSGPLLNETNRFFRVKLYEP